MKNNTRTYNVFADDEIIGIVTEDTLHPPEIIHIIGQPDLFYLKRYPVEGYFRARIQYCITFKPNTL